MNPSKTLLALTAAAGVGHYSQAESSQAHSRVSRATQGNGGQLNMISGSGVEEAELPPEPSTTVVIQNYSEEQCTAWLDAAFAVDADGSGGMSESEFHSFLLGIKDPPYVAKYFAKYDGSYQDLPWLFQVVHKSLACRCEDLGMGPGCCTGDDPDISFAGLGGDEGLTAQQKGVAEEYKADLCNMIAVVFEKLIDSPAPTTAAPSTAPTLAANSTAPTTAPVETTLPPTEPQLVLIVPESGHAFECVDENACNDNLPSYDEDSSGWAFLGNCGEGTEYGACPESHDSEASYGKGDDVAMDANIFEREPPAPKRVEIDVVGSVLDYSSFVVEYSSFDWENPGEGVVPDHWKAADILADEGGESILRQVIVAFGTLAGDLVSALTTGVVTEEGKKRRHDENVRGLQLATLGELEPFEVTDIPCPAGLMYAPQGAYCLNFKAKLTLDARNEYLADQLPELFRKAIDVEGKLYDTVKATNPDTTITGLGSPGKGIDYLSQLSQPNVRSAEAEEENKGLSTVAIILIILAIILIPMAIIAMYARYRKVKEKERQERLAALEANKRALEQDLEAPEGSVPEADEPDQAPKADDPCTLEDLPEEDDESSAPSVWSESSEDSEVLSTRASYVEDETYGEQRASAGSALAAMGTMGAAAALAPGKNSRSGSDNSTNSDDEREKREPPAMSTMGVASAMAPGRNYDSGQYDPTRSDGKNNAEMEAEIRSLAKETNAPKSADELLASYAGREDVLLSHLRALKQKTAENNTDQMKAEIRSLVKETNSPKPADELLAMYAGREEVLLSHLRALKQKSVQSSNAEMKEEIRSLVKDTKSPKSADKLLAMYVGREDVLLAHLKALKKKGDEDTAAKSVVDNKTANIRAEVEALVNQINTPRTADELLIAYQGKEEVLISHLKQMKERQSMNATADEPPAGDQPSNIDRELLTRLSSRKEKEADPAGAVTSKISDSNKTKSASGINEGFRSFMANPELRKYSTPSHPHGDQSKPPNNAAAPAMPPSTVRADIRAEVESLVLQTQPGKSVDQLLAAFHGREQDLIANLRKLKQSQRQIV